jgi:hypothetical protein
MNNYINTLNNIDDAYGVYDYEINELLNNF